MLRIDSRIVRGTKDDHLRSIIDFFHKALSSQFEAKEIEEAWIGKLTTEIKRLGFDTWSTQLQPIDHDIPECIKPMIDGYLLNLTDALLIAEPDLPKIDYHCAEIKKPELLTREIFSRLAKKMFCKSTSSDNARRLLIVFKEFSALLNASPALKKYSLLDQALSLVMSRQGTFTALNRILLKDEEWVTQFEQGIEFSATVNANHAAVKHAIAHTQDRLHILKIQLAGTLAAELGTKVSPANCTNEYIDNYLETLNKSFERKKTKSEYCLAKIKNILELKKEMEEIQTALSKFQTLLDLTGWVIILMDIFDVEQLAKLVESIDGKIELIDAGVGLPDEKHTQDNGYLQALTDHKKTSQINKIRASANCAQELRKLRSLKVQKEVLRLFTASITALHNSSLMMQGELVKFINTGRFEELQGWVPPIKKISQCSQELPSLSSPMRIEDLSLELTTLSASSSVSLASSSSPASLPQKKLSTLPSHSLLSIAKDVLIGNTGSLFSALAQILNAAEENKRKYNAQSLQQTYDAYHQQHGGKDVENPIILLCRYFKKVLPCIHLIEISNDPDSKKEGSEKVVTHSLVTEQGILGIYVVATIETTIPILILDKDTLNYTPILSTVKKPQLTHKHAGQKQGSATSSMARSSPLIQRAALKQVSKNLSITYQQEQEPLMNSAEQREREEEAKIPLTSTAKTFKGLASPSPSNRNSREKSVEIQLSYCEEELSVFLEIEQLLNKSMPTDDDFDFLPKSKEFIEENAAKRLDKKKFCHPFHKEIQEDVLAKYEEQAMRNRYHSYFYRYKGHQLAHLKRHQSRLKAALFHAQENLHPLKDPQHPEHSTYELQLEYVNRVFIGALGEMCRDMPWHKEAQRLYLEWTKSIYPKQISEIDSQNSKKIIINLKSNLTRREFDACLEQSPAIAKLAQEVDALKRGSISSEQPSSQPPEEQEEQADNNKEKVLVKKPSNNMSWDAISPAVHLMPVSSHDDASSSVTSSTPTLAPSSRR